MAERLRAVVFDLDGTLVDSAPDLATALNTLLAENGRRALSLDEVRARIGDGVAVLVTRGLEATGGVPAAEQLEPLVARFQALYSGPATVALTRPYPGVPETLERLRGSGLRLGLCTNKIQAATNDLLSALSLDRCFDAIVGGDQVPARKPDPAHVRAVLQRLDATPAEAAMVGDGPNDVAAGRGAGLPVVCLSYGYARGAPEALGADILIDRFADLPDALARLDARRGP